MKVDTDKIEWLQYVTNIELIKMAGVNLSTLEDQSEVSVKSVNLTIKQDAC